MFDIDPNSSQPIYLEIANTIIKLIINKTYVVDNKLPSIRYLSQLLSINHNTIKRAYQELEDKGYVYAISGSGMYVSDNISALVSQEMNNILDDFSNNVLKIKEINVDKDDLIKIINKIYEGEK